MIADVIEELSREVRCCLRGLFRARRFACVGVLTIGLAIATVVVVVSALDIVVLRAVPGSDVARLVSVAVSTRAVPTIRLGLAHAEVDRLRRREDLFDELASYKPPGSMSWGGPTDAPVVTSAAVSPTFFALFGVPPRLGRWLSQGDFDPTAEDTAVVSFAAWRRYLAADPAALGKMLLFNGREYRLVGIAPQEFSFPTDVDVWIPDRELAHERPDAVAGQNQVIGRVKVGVAPQSIVGMVDSIRPGERPSEAVFSAVLLRDQAVGPVGIVIVLLGVVVAMVFTISCLNVATLFAARDAVRERELAVRFALGAGTFRLIRQAWLESAIVSLGGAILGVALAYPSLALIRHAGVATAIPRLGQVAVDSGAVLIGMAGAGLASLVCCLLSAVRLPAVTSSGFGRYVTRRASGHYRPSGIRRQSVFIVTQVALTLVLITGTGTLVKRLTSLMTISPGFDTAGLFALELARPVRRDLDEIQTQRLLEELRRSPGVAAVGAVAYLRHVPETALAAERSPGEWIPFPRVSYQIVSDSVFETMRIGVLAGRTFNSFDNWRTPCTVIVNRLLATAAWPQADPIGKSVNLSTTSTGVPIDSKLICRVVGVVGDTRTDLKAEPVPQIYFAYLGRRLSPGTNIFLVRVDDNRRASVASLSKLVASVANRRVESAESVDVLVGQNIVTPKFYLILFGSFSALALALTAVGMYGSLRELVTHRRVEFGIRLALGAQPREVRALILGFAGQSVLVGLAIGATAAAATGRYLDATLFGTRSPDGLVVLLAAVVVLLASGVAVLGPARWAARIQPRELLH